jgi:hypothetical protein
MPTWTRWPRRLVNCGQRAGQAPEDPDGDEDTDLDGRDHVADRLSDEVDWLRQCAGWLRQLDDGGYPPTVNLGGISRPPLRRARRGQGAAHCRRS